MTRTITVVGLALLLPLLLAWAQVAADTQPGRHQHETERHEHDARGHHGADHHGHTATPATPRHDDDTPHGQIAGPEPGHGSDTRHGAHRHAQWVEPPPAYADKRSNRWADPAAIARGQQLYQHSCIICHGPDGTGTGPAAKALPHPPADLTNHFHRPPHDGDAYLFWRVSEGGAVEPFTSMQSAMPPFKTMLSEDQRWDVLAYVHAFFHLGLAEWDPTVPQQDTQSHDEPAAVSGQGTVVAVVPGNDQLVMQHGKLPGFMDAMTMGYTVQPPSLLEGLAAGDRIRFTIDPDQMAIVELHKVSE